MAKPTHYLFDFPAFIEELRENDEKKETIEKYEKFVLNGEKITGDIKDQKWYIDYLSQFDKLPAYKVPEELEDDFDWTILFQLVVGSFSSRYRLSYQSVDEEGKATLPDLLITAQSGDQLIEKAVSELWSFQVLRLYEIYIEEQINLELLIHEDDTDEKEKRALCQERRNIIKRYRRRFDPPKPKKQEDKKNQKDEEENFICSHYCSLESAYHIMNSGKMYASDLTYMNDASELTFGIDVLMTALKVIVNKKRIKSGFRKWLQQIINNDSQLRNGLEQAPVYISCFCREEDTLNQWRSYGDNGNGVCIVFNFDKTLRKLGRDLSDGFFMKNVKYLSRTYNKNTWEAVIKEIEKEFEIIYNNSKNADIEQIFQYLTPSLRRNIRYYKNEKFHEEKEFRQVCLNIENDDFFGRDSSRNYKLFEVKTRAVKDYIIPYIDLNICNIYGESAITKIIIGPSVKDFDKTKRSFERFITELNKKKAIERINRLCWQVTSQLPINETIMGHTKTLREAIYEKTLIIVPTRERVLQKAQDAFETFLNAIKEKVDEKEFTKVKKFVKEELDSINTHLYIKLEKSDEELTSPNEDRSIIQKSVIPYLP